jgi:hypothetical protein
VAAVHFWRKSEFHETSVFLYWLGINMKIRCMRKREWSYIKYFTPLHCTLQQAHFLKAAQFKFSVKWMLWQFKSHFIIGEILSFLKRPQKFEKITHLFLHYWVNVKTKVDNLPKINKHVVQNKCVVRFFLKSN